MLDPTTLDVETATTSEALEMARVEWMDLWHRCPDATPFQTPAWLIAWWRQFGAGDLLVLMLRRDRRLVGLVPLFAGDDQGARTLRLIGTGITDYLDALFDPELGEGGPATLFRWLDGERTEWDVCDLQQLPPTSSLLAAGVPEGWIENREAQDACPVLSLPGRVEMLDRQLPRRTVQHLRANRRRADRAGHVDIDAADEGTAESFLRALFRLHGARWSLRGLPGVLEDAAVRAFHEDAAAELLQQGLLRLYALRLNGEIAAVYYGFAGKGKAYAYLGGFDPACERLSLGSQVIAHAMQQAVREGVAEFHFLRGREDYKYKWGARDRLNQRRLLRRNDS